MKVALAALIKTSMPEEMKGSVDLALMVAALGLMQLVLECLPRKRQ